MVVPFSFEEANQKDGRNSHHQEGPLEAAHHQANIHRSQEEESSLDDDAQMAKVLAMVNNPHENEGSFQVVLAAYPVHRKGESPRL